jgi:hypothetical protein
MNTANVSLVRIKIRPLKNKMRLSKPHKQNFMAGLLSGEKSRRVIMVDFINDL